MDNNRFQRAAEVERAYRQLSKDSGVSRNHESIDRYFSMVDELKAYMLSEGMLRLPVRGVHVQDNPDAHITSDGRIVAVYTEGIGPFRRQTTRQYHLGDLSEVIGFLIGKKEIVHLDQVSQSDLQKVEKMIDNSVKFNL